MKNIKKPQAASFVKTIKIYALLGNSEKKVGLKKKEDNNKINIMMYIY